MQAPVGSAISARWWWWRLRSSPARTAPVFIFSMPSRVLVRVDLPALNCRPARCCNPRPATAPAHRRWPGPGVDVHHRHVQRARRSCRAASTSAPSLSDLVSTTTGCTPAARHQQQVALDPARIEVGIQPADHEHAVDVGRDDLLPVVFAGRAALIAESAAAGRRCRRLLGRALDQHPVADRRALLGRQLALCGSCRRAAIPAAIPRDAPRPPTRRRGSRCGAARRCARAVPADARPIAAQSGSRVGGVQRQPMACRGTMRVRAAVMAGILAPARCCVACPGGGDSSAPGMARGRPSEPDAKPSMAAKPRPAGRARSAGLFRYAGGFALPLPAPMSPYNPATRSPPAPASPKSATRSAANWRSRARELEARPATDQLNIGNPGALASRAPEHLQRAIADRIERTDPYTHQQGLPEARRGDRRFPQGARHPECPAERVFVGNGQRADRHRPARPAQPGRGSAGALARLPVVERGHHPQRRPPGLLQVRPRQRLPAGPDQIESLVSPRTRAIPDQPQQPDRRQLPARLAGAHRRHRPALPPAAAGRRDLRPHPVRRRGVPAGRAARRRPALPELRRPVQCIAPAAGGSAGRCCPSDPVACGDFHHAMDLLGALRLCANVPGQFAIEQALHGADTHHPLCRPGGRLYETRRAWSRPATPARTCRWSPGGRAGNGFPRVVGPAAQGFDDHGLRCRCSKRKTC